MLVKLGEAPPPVKARHGCYAEWFARAWDGPLTVADGRVARIPPGRDFAGVIISGSSASLTEPEPWMDEATDFVRRCRDDGTPLLGVCFGHQLIGRAFGAKVVVNPTGWEVGTCQVAVHRSDDPLFHGLAETIQVNLTHRDMIHAAENTDLEVLASNEATPIQAVGVDDHIRGVQFHPEIIGSVARAYIDARRHLLADRDPDAIIARTTDSDHGVRVMRNFRRHFVERS